jgi:hypothetical protein
VLNNGAYQSVSLSAWMAANRMPVETDLMQIKRATAALATCIVQTLNESDPTSVIEMHCRAFRLAEF